jgi:hypothetical protein
MSGNPFGMRYSVFAKEDGYAGPDENARRERIKLVLSDGTPED